MPSKLPPSNGPVVIRTVVRRQAESRRRHSGAWKVAYADFVTALMALFIVLWMMNASDSIKFAVAGYFRDPRASTERLGAGPAGPGEGLLIDRRSIHDIQHQIEMALRRMPDFKIISNNVKFSVTGEGLRIDLMENEAGMFFVTGSPHPTAAGESLLRLLAEELCRMHNRIVIEGHTDAQPFRDASETATAYGNWELSTDRANAARRLLLTYGVPSQQIVEVRGFADQQLLLPRDPDNPRNRRVSLVVRFQDPAPAAATAHSIKLSN
ncbi:MAG TPA: flagellar motor protein MotB [Bryobacteraceae bacterium]|nr:flagellar motor protein MotB [Bryobacteraceae bacterium]